MALRVINRAPINASTCSAGFRRASAVNQGRERNHKFHHHHSTLQSWARLLCCSSYGEVFTARDRASGQVVAIKVIPIEGDSGDIKREIDILKQLREKSPYIVSYLGSYTKDGSLWIVMVGGGVMAERYDFNA